MKLKSTVTAGGQTGTETLIQGFVKFNLDNVYVPGLGNFHVKSEYPRLKPKFEREHVDDSIVEALCTQQLAWVNAHFETIGQEEYFKELVLTCVHFVMYTDAQLTLHTKKMELSFQLIIWLWFNDDVIEKAISNAIDFRELKQGVDQIQLIFTGTYDNNPKPEFKDVPNNPVFRNLFYSLLEWHNICRDFLPDYENLIKSFASNLKKYFIVVRWLRFDQIDERYSEESFKMYRKTVAFFDGIADGVAVINGVKLSDDILNSELMKRLLDIANAFGGFGNDILGMRKEFANGERDNLIVFLVLEKKIPLQVAVQQVCDHLATELADYVLMKRVILNEFDYDENLIRYLDILDALIDGHHMIYMKSIRHRAIGLVSLTR